jgi:predicted glycosyltransferase
MGGPGGLAGELSVRIWFDVENPPQVQYLSPLAEAFGAAGADIVVTARDYGSTLELMKARGLPFEHVGERYGRSKAAKAYGLLGRALSLSRFHRGRPRPDALVHAGRASSLVARRLGVPIFTLRDYEWVDMRVERLTAAAILFPEVIDRSAFESRGIRADRLLPFAGLKEDLSFANVNVDTVSEYRPETDVVAAVRALVRPPAEESHYYRSESGRLAEAALERLAAAPEVQVLFSPRYPHQADLLERLSWSTPPVVLAETIPFVSLLKAVDLVVTAGGTMAREAAYLGVPAYSIFRGETGGVDRHLASIGRLHLLTTPEDVSRIGLEPLGDPTRLSGNPALPEQLVELVAGRLGGRRR